MAYRRTLLNKYAIRWMLALHDQDTQFYSQAVYELVVEQSEDEYVKNIVQVDDEAGQSVSSSLLGMPNTQDANSKKSYVSHSPTGVYVG